MADSVQKSFNKHPVGLWPSGFGKFLDWLSEAAPSEVPGGQGFRELAVINPRCGNGDPHLRGRCVGIFNGEFRGGFFLLPGDQRGSNMACPEIDESGSWVKS